MNNVSPRPRGTVRGRIIAAFLIVAAAVSVAAAQGPVGGALPLQGGGQGSGRATDARRMVVLLFDANSLSLSDAQLVRDQALRWSDSEPLWLTSIVTTGPMLTVISDFVESVELGRVLRSAAFLNAIVAPGGMPQAIRFGGNPAAQDPGAATPPVDPQLIDQRLRGIAMVCETVAPIPQRKAIIYFSNSLTAASAAAALTPGNQAMRAATNACNRANVTINPIDTRGLLATVASPTAN